MFDTLTGVLPMAETFYFEKKIKILLMCFHLEICTKRTSLHWIYEYYTMSRLQRVI